MLDLGKADARRLVLIKEWVTPDALVQEVAAIMQTALSEKGLWLRLERAEDLPEIFVDRTRIRQVLINLLGNSLRFTETGGITISVSKRIDDLLFAVCDTGPGIAPEETAKVFEDFGQTNATIWRRRDGAGLGVPISRRLVTMHGGQMWMESEVGQGTRFYFTLPLPGAASLDLPADLDSREYWRLMADHSRAPKLAVIISDDPNAGELLKGWLPEHRVVTADPAAAAAQIAGLLPQAILLDQTVAARPEISALLADLPYDPPVLTLGLPGSAPHSREWPAGLAAYLMKPIQRAGLVATLRGLPLAAPRLLVVDDDPAMARFVRLALAGEAGQAAIEVVPALTGEAALRWLAQTEQLPGAILLDLTLADMSGWEILRRLQETPGWRQIPAIAVTAVSLPEELEARERKLLQLSTARPLTGDELAAAVTALLGAVPPKFPDAHQHPTPPRQTVTLQAVPAGPGPPETRAG